MEKEETNVFLGKVANGIMADFGKNTSQRGYLS